MALELITPPVESPVTLEEAKAQLRIDHDDDDVYIQGLIDAAVGMVDGRYGSLGRALEPQTWELVLDRFPCWPYHICLPLPPLLSVDSITYIDGDGAEQTIDAANYEVDTTSVPGRLKPAGTGSWPTAKCVTNAVRIRFTAGYERSFADSGDEESDGSVTYSTVPAPIKAAIKIIVSAMNEDRELAEIPPAANLILFPYKVLVLA